MIAVNKFQHFYANISNIKATLFLSPFVNCLQRRLWLLLINHEWKLSKLLKASGGERALALTFQLKQIIIRGACVWILFNCGALARRWRSVSRDRTQRIRVRSWILSSLPGNMPACISMNVHGIIISYLWPQCKRNYQLDMGHCSSTSMGCEAASTIQPCIFNSTMSSVWCYA